MDITTSVVHLARNVISEEEKRKLLQTDFEPMLNLLLDLTTLFPDQRKEAQEALKIWMQLLHNCLTEARSLLHRPQPGRARRCLDRVICNPRTLSQEINEWKVLFDCLFRELQSDLSIFVTARHFIHITDPIPALSAEGSEQLYQSYDALPTSDLKNCFLYSAIYGKDASPNVTQLVQMWIAEGLVRSKQETHLMDMAIARAYVNLLLDRRFFHSATNQVTQSCSVWKYYSFYEGIRVDGDIRELAMNIAEKEQNCLLKAGQTLQHFPTVHSEDWERISLGSNEIEDLPSELPCPKLVSLILSDNEISVVPSGFLVGLTSLKVLDLSRNWSISSIPSSVGQLQQLQLLRLNSLSKIKELPEEIGHLSSLQFLSLAMCHSLESLPSQIGQLQNLKYLNISGCWRLRVIPHEISQHTALTTLDMQSVKLSVEAESERSICRLKGLINLTMLRIHVEEGNTSSGIEGGIMGTWLDMGHLELSFPPDGDVMDDLPDDMQNMRKLQSLRMDGYRGLSLPEYSCKFQHLQHLELRWCRHLKELSPLDRLPNLEVLVLAGLDKLESMAGASNNGVWNERTLPRLRILRIERCRHLKELSPLDRLPNLEELVLWELLGLESMAGASNNGVWNERTLPRLRILRIFDCPNLKRLPVGMDKLLSLKTLRGTNDWWQQIIWEDEHMKRHIANLFANLFEEL